MLIRGIKYKSGQIILAKWDCGKSVIGALHIDEDRLFICHNADFKVGSESPDLHGFKHSWVFSYNARYDSFSEDIEVISPLFENLEHLDSKLSEDLTNFFRITRTFLTADIASLFKFKVKPIEGLVSLGLSEKPGFVSMSVISQSKVGNTEKNIEVKLSRLVRQVSNNLSKFLNPEVTAEAKSIIDFSDSDIEKLNNAFVAHQSGELLSLEFLTGDDIKAGYDSKNYSFGHSTLHKSCMTNKFDYLDIYTKNPNHVKLAVFKLEDKIVGRCLIWNVDGVEYFDRIYYAQDWINGHIYDRLIKAGYKFLSDDVKSSVLSIKLDFVPDEKYPYLDNFNRLNLKEGILYAANSVRDLPRGNYYRILNSISGRFEEIGT